MTRFIIFFTPNFTIFCLSKYSTKNEATAINLWDWNDGPPNLSIGKTVNVLITSILYLYVFYSSLMKLDFHQSFYYWTLNFLSSSEIILIRHSVLKSKLQSLRASKSYPFLSPMFSCFLILLWPSRPASPLFWPVGRWWERSVLEIELRPTICSSYQWMKRHWGAVYSIAIVCRVSVRF